MPIYLYGKVNVWELHTHKINKDTISKSQSMFKICKCSQGKDNEMKPSWRFLKDLFMMAVSNTGLCLLILQFEIHCLQSTVVFKLKHKSIT